MFDGRRIPGYMQISVSRQQLWKKFKNMQITMVGDSRLTLAGKEWCVSCGGQVARPGRLSQ